jgi:hypothetical protein
MYLVSTYDSCGSDIVCKTFVYKTPKETIKKLLETIFYDGVMNDGATKIKLLDEEDEDDGDEEYDDEYYDNIEEGDYDPRDAKKDETEYDCVYNIDDFVNLIVDKKYVFCGGIGCTDENDPDFEIVLHDNLTLSEMILKIINKTVDISYPPYEESYDEVICIKYVEKIKDAYMRCVIRFD